MDEHSGRLSEHLEDYLEAIAQLESESGAARPTDIAATLKIKKPSVTSALGALSERGLVVYEKYKPVSLTPEGRKVAASVRRKHELLRGFFVKILGVDQASADVAACRMEHALDDSIMHKLVKFLRSLEK